MQTTQLLVQRSAPPPNKAPEPAAPVDPHDKHVAYGSLMATFCAGVVAVVAAARKPATQYAGNRTTARVPWGDLVLLGLATHKIARITAKDRVAEPLRAAVTKDAQGREPQEGALRHSLGELVTCQYCLAPWLAAGMLGAYVYRPAAARLVASIFGIVAVSDVSNRVYSRLSDK